MTTSRSEGRGRQRSSAMLPDHPGGAHRGGRSVPYRIKALGAMRRPELADGELSLFNCSFCRALPAAGPGRNLTTSSTASSRPTAATHALHVRELASTRRTWISSSTSRCPISSATLPGLLRGGARIIKKQAMEDHFSTQVTEGVRWKNHARMAESARAMAGGFRLREMDSPAGQRERSARLEIKGSSMRSEDFAALLTQFIAERKNSPG